MTPTELMMALQSHLSAEQQDEYEVLMDTDGCGYGALHNVKIDHDQKRVILE